MNGSDSSIGPMGFDRVGPLPTDMLMALQSFTDSKRMLDKIENIIEFALEDDFK